MRFSQLQRARQGIFALETFAAGNLESRVKHQTKSSVLLFGPSLARNPAGFGGGKGGIVSALTLIKEEFCSDSDIELTYVPYSVRSFSKTWWLLLPFRFVTDLVSLVRHFKGVGVVHIAATSGPAVVRSLAAVVLAKSFGKRVVLDVRGGGLDAFSNDASGVVTSFCWQMMIEYSDRVFVQRQRTAQALGSTYQGKVYHQPNTFPDSDIPDRLGRRLDHHVLKVMFAGYCYRGKGVFDIVEGCRLACIRGLEIDLTLVGQEHEEFAEYLDSREACPGLSIRRQGKQSRHEVLALMRQSDVFLFPTYHPGEGHPNVINEAMGNQLTIIGTRWGAIGEILDDETAYFVEPRSPAQVADALCHVDSNRDEARERGENARRKLISEYLASRVLSNLRQTYLDLMSSPCPSGSTDFRT